MTEHVDNSEGKAKDKGARCDCGFVSVLEWLETANDPRWEDPYAIAEPTSCGHFPEGQRLEGAQPHANLEGEDPR